MNKPYCVWCNRSGHEPTPECQRKSIDRRRELAAKNASLPAGQVIEAARQEIVLAIAFLGRDGGTERAAGTIASLIERLAQADARLRGYLTENPDVPAEQTPPALECWAIIEQLRGPEGAEVCLFCDNPDVGAGANNALEVCDYWTEWRHVRFEGETILEALRAALRASKGEARG